MRRQDQSTNDEANPVVDDDRRDGAGDPTLVFRSEKDRDQLTLLLSDSLVRRLKDRQQRTGEIEQYL
jgi:hypothetical protein